MLRKLLCTLNVGHHWLAETDQDGTLRRHCIHCGKYDHSGARWSGRRVAGDYPAEPGGTDFPASPFS
jgi:hypothetical protein